MRKDNQQVIAEQVSRMMQRAQHKLDYFNNRLVRARFVALPSQRLVRTAEEQARWYADELASLSLELERAEREWVPQLRLRPSCEKDARTFFPWLIQPAIQDALMWEEALSPEAWYVRFQRWLMEPDHYPYSVERYDGRLIGLMLVRRMGRDWRERSGRLEISIIDSRWRHLGYGSEALRRIVQELAEQEGVAPIQLTVAYDNTPAIRSFEKAGFHAVAMMHAEGRELFEMQTAEETNRPASSAERLTNPAMSHQLCIIREWLFDADEAPSTGGSHP